MVLESLQLLDFRNYHRAELAPGPGVNILVGPNGAGKTNLLEAVALALSGRSPRGARDGELVRHGAERYMVRASVRTRTGRHVLAAAGPTPSGRQVRVDGSDVDRRTLLGLAPHVWFGPDDLELLKGGPAARRRFLDWLAARLEPVHAGELLAYARVLAQRNELLRDVRQRRSPRALADLFDEQLVQTGLRIVQRRLAVLRRLEPLAQGRHRQLAGDGQELRLCYAGDAEADPAGGERAAEAALRRLDELREEEIARGQTLWGPQRHDVRVLLDGMPARHHASQGQQRTIVLAIKLAEYELLRATWGEEPLLLLDDVLSELDADRAAALARFAAAAGQVLLTTADPAAAAAFPGVRRFAVHQGAVRGLTAERAPGPEAREAG